MNEIYKKIVQMVNDYCHSIPKEGFEISYLQNARYVLDLYQDAEVILDKYEDKDPDLMNESLDKIRQNLEEFVN